MLLFSRSLRFKLLGQVSGHCLQIRDFRPLLFNIFIYLPNFGPKQCAPVLWVGWPITGSEDLIPASLLERLSVPGSRVSC